MPNKRNTYIGGMDQDTSNSKQDGTKYYKGVNIKVLSEEGSSSGNIENEDGNITSFNIPDTLGFWKIRFNNPENPSTGELSITLNNTSYSTGNVDNIEDLFSQLVGILSNTNNSNYKLIQRGQFIYIIPLTDNIITNVTGSAGLSDNNNTYEVEPQTGLKIIGWTTLRDDVILFTTNETSSAPDSAGQIWKFDYNPITKTINNIGSNNTLSLNDHLIYNNKLNFSTHWHIGTEAIGHYENSKTGRVYWTDEYNQLRTINALDPDLMGISPGDISIVSSVDLSIPVLDYVTSGGSLPNGAVVQYTYRLFNAGGGQTTFAPLCNPIPLGQFDPLSDSVGNRPWEADGDTTGTGDKSVTYNLTGLDPSYNYIEHVAVVTIGSSTTIYKFAEEAVPSDGTLTVTHTSTGDNIPITAEELAFLTRTFKRCKTITVKDKRLIAANLDTLDTTVDGWDSRAYRFNSVANGKTALLEDKEIPNVTLSAATSTPNWSSVPEEHDCINPYNSEPHLTSTFAVNTANQYKYQTDGVTLGGEGENVSYRFTTQDVSLKATASGAGSAGFAPNGDYNTIHYNRFNAAPYNNTADIQLNGEDRVSPGEYQSFLSPVVTNTFTGYARGEVYRFGVCFYDLSGNPFNVKWIGDIKIPEATEQVGSSFPYRITKSDIADSNLFDWNYPIQGQSIGIEFTLDLSNLLGLISGYEIVRVKRDVNNRTRLGTGIMTNFGLLDGDNFTGRRFPAKYNGIYVGANPLPSGPTGWQDSDVLEVQGNGATGTAIINDAPIFSYTAGLRTPAIISPTSILRQDSKYAHRNGDTIRTLGFYKDHYEAGTNYQKRNSDNHNGATDTILAGYNILGRAWETNSSCQEYKEIEKEAQIEMGDVLSSTDWHGPSDLGKTFANCSAGTRDGLNRYEDPAGVGGQKQVINIPTRFDYFSPTSNISSLPSTTPPFITPQVLQSLPSAGVLTTPVESIKSYWWREVSYDRTLANQYGGNTYEARSGNIYQSTGTFKSIKEWSNSSQTITAFGGDVYVNMFHYQFYELNYSSLNRGNFDVNDYKYHLGMCFPVESPVNIDYMDAGHFSDTDYLRGIGNVDSVGEATYTLGDHYTKENNTKQIYFPPDFIENTVEEHPHRIWASEPKLDGELLDSWRVFLTNNFTEVEGQYGEINKITTLRDRFFFFQDRAFGSASINDRSVINDENGVELSLGSGGILDDFGYISRNSGTKHKFSVIPTGSSIHYYDILLKKWMRYGQGNLPLSDVKGLHSFFLKNINSNILANDRILEGVGIHGVFDRVRNKVYMTFLDANTSSGTNVGNGAATGSGSSVLTDTETSATSDASNGASSASSSASDLSLGGSNGSSGSDVILGTSSETNYTICYNENSQAFEHFVDRIPYLYLENDGRLITTNSNLTTGYLEYEGNKNTFYGITYPSRLELIISPTADITSVFDTIEYKGEIFINDIDQPNLTMDTIQVINDHQDSGIISLTVGGNVIRKLRSWRTNIPRDASNNNPRIRDYYIKLILTHTPTNNERMILHDIITNYRITPH